MKRCHRCGTEWAAEKRQPGPKEYCEHCAAYLHCCLNCRFHDASAPNECRIPNTDGIRDRAGANFCDEFEFADTIQETTHRESSRGARDAFGALFGESGAPKQGTDDSRDLFGG